MEPLYVAAPPRYTLDIWESGPPLPSATLSRPLLAGDEKPLANQGRCSAAN